MAYSSVTLNVCNTIFEKQNIVFSKHDLGYYVAVCSIFANGEITDTKLLSLVQQVVEVLAK
jgi:hypothetical protein